MKRINLLDTNTSNKIAAGEVVERPSSVVKELIENSIDAKAKKIVLEIENGGESLIKVTDDGNGIHPDDIEKAFMPHATSKIQSIEDVYNINTLGFRGEALPSIASISHINIKSKSTEFDTGRMLQIEGGITVINEEVSMPNGTQIEVKDLFFNVPARKKFLKSQSREAALINEIISRIAIANPDIAIEYHNNGKKVFNTYGNGNMLDAIRTIFGKNIVDNLIYFEGHTDTSSAYGYIGKEEISRGSRNNQILFVNKRYVKNRLATVAVENAFKSFSTVNKFPFFILLIDIYPELIDVNIHPQKAEIKFKDDRSIYKIAFDSVHKALKDDVFESFRLPEEQAQEEKVENIPLDLDFHNFDKVYHPYVNTQNDYIVKENDDESTYEDKQKVVDLPIDLKPISFTKEEVTDNNQITDTGNRASDANKSYIENNQVIETDSSVKNNYKAVEEKGNAKIPNLRIIGQFNKTYIIGEYDDTMYLIDQHAAHEKILFEKYLKDIENSHIQVQSLLVPCVINLIMDDYEIILENKSIFEKAGFLIEDFGDNSILLKEVPYFLDKLNPKSLLLDIIDNLKNLGSGKTSEVKYNRIATMACKAAVKAHDLLSTEEMYELLNTLRFIDDPFHCPHGRPTIIKLTLNELEKKFRRIQ
ncbi:DNA mismatch repair endonuclease MutL [Clostridium folliculivorans]|uniref:DNA mismatch repair protein MutL n=1 Tax=Clostridium folliculivorans TaxID=2886038 RepID=A0A9W5Y0X7_9CLOT|nr:DNA mismatch repair endonuclease MutL [Clostridium folliculivorans]GKU24714.1 DNA mismatch repair protein MutL [Clostridium folliculivorans]GKU30812.1 DNA mismatch repair protein MutL [Clostridium folliculivorans]